MQDRKGTSRNYESQKRSKNNNKNGQFETLRSFRQSAVLREDLEFHVFRQCKSLLSKTEFLGYDLDKLREMKDVTERKLAMDEIEKAMLKEGSYSAALLVDAYAQQSDPKRANLRHIICERSLPNKHNLILSIIFETTLGNEKDAYRHLLFKCWPLRCWTRKFVSVTSGYFEVDTQLEGFVNHLVLCSLLGNYQHNRIHPPRAVRAKLYDMLDYRRHQTYRSDAAKAFRKRLLTETRRVYLHAIQEYICWSINTSAAVQRQVEHIMPFDAFQQVVTQVNDKFRAIVAAGWNSDDKLMEDLAAVVQDARDDILDVSYEKACPPFIEYLKDVKSFAKPSSKLWFERYFNPAQVERKELTRGGYVKPSTEIAKGIQKAATAAAAAAANGKGGGGDEDELEEMEMDEKQKFEPLKPANPADPKLLDAQIAEFFSERSQQQKQETHQKPEQPAIRVTSMHITAEHSKQLEFLISHFDPTTADSDDIFKKVIQCFPAFGCTVYASEEIRSMMIEYKIFKKAKEDWKERMEQYNQRHPYAYCLIQATRRFIVALRQIQYFPLPKNVIQAQMQSIQTKHGTPDFRDVPEECIYFYACSCCREVNSLLQSHKNNQKQNCTEGLREVFTDLRDGKLYCKKGDIYAHKRCVDAPLMQILGLGKLILFRKRAVVFCCQPGCGARPMQVDPDHTTFNEHGIACSTCTLGILHNQYEEYKQRHGFLTEARKTGKCFLCDKALSKHKAFYMFAQNTYVCYRHSERLVNKYIDHVEGNLPDAVCSSAFQNQVSALRVQAKMKEFKTKHAAAIAPMQSKRNNLILKQLKNAKVAARGGHS